MRDGGRGPSQRGAVPLPSGFVVIIIVAFLVVQGLGIISPVLPSLAEQRGLSSAASALLLSSVACGRLLFSLPGGPLADRYGFRSVAVGSSLAVALCAAVAAATPSYGVLVAAQVGQGMGSAVFTTAAMAAIVKATPQAAVGRALARFQGAILVGLSVSPLLGGLAADLIGVSGPFWVYSAGAALAALLSATALPRGSARVVPRHAVRPPVKAVSLLVHRPLLMANLVAFATFWAVGGIRNTLVPLFGEAEFGMSAVANGAVLAGAAIANVIALAPAGRIADTVGRRPAIRIGMLAGTGTTLALAPVTDAWMLLLVVDLTGAAKGLVSVAPLAVVADVVDDVRRGTAVGLSRSAAELGLVLGPVMVGALSDLAGARAAFAWSAAALAVATAVTWSVPETLGRSRRSQREPSTVPVASGGTSAT